MNIFTGIFKDECPSYTAMRRIAICLDVSIDSLTSILVNGKWVVFLKGDFKKGFIDHPVLGE